MIKRVLKGEKPDGFRVLKTRLQKSLPTIEGDMNLARLFLKTCLRDSPPLSDTELQDIEEAEKDIREGRTKRFKSGKALLAYLDTLSDEQ